MIIIVKNHIYVDLCDEATKNLFQAKYNILRALINNSLIKQLNNYDWYKSKIHGKCLARSCVT